MTDSFSRGRLARAVAALPLFLLVTVAAVAADTPPRDATRAPAASASGQAETPRCVHGCLRWGKVCNVDPRGVYKCQRRCEKFGEICE
ncbi:MAG: hypothetical protein RLW62_16480 [Gammaproteobacteria bacterium]